MNNLKISVIISTYNSEEWLQKVLWGYANQNYKDFEMIIADDGSNHKTKDMVSEMQKELSFPISHVWHDDDGFQKSKILNKAIMNCTTDYIVMSDGDCIPRPDFLEVHNNYKKKGCFLSGGYFKLPMETSRLISKKHIFSGDCFDPNWLVAHGVKRSFKLNKFNQNQLMVKFFNLITPTRASWNGNNSSGWKQDILAVNGFDERMQYGGQDRELGERMINNGIKPKQIRYSTTSVHLDHSRGYKNQETLLRNKNIRNQTKSNKSTWTQYGIIKGEQKNKG